MTVYLATDHAGFTTKEEVKKKLLERGYEIVDCGASTLDPADDYPDFVKKAARELSKNSEARAILFGGSGEGEAMVANRFPRVRAAVYYGGSLDILRLSREHNDANALSIGARFVTAKEACDAAENWLETAFSKEDRHARRIKKIDD